MKTFALNFYEVQRRQWQKSLLLFLVLVVFYYLAVGFVTMVFLLSLGLFAPGRILAFGDQPRLLLLITAAISLLIAAFHFYDARRFGAEFIRKRLQVKSPDAGDRYHKQFANTVEEIRLAAGLPQVNTYVIPVFAINSMALIERNNTPSVLVTEGLIAEFTRDEIQAVIAHELAHITRGDTFYVTLVCSLANFFERLRQAVEPEEASPAAGIHPAQEYEGGHILVYLAASLSGLVIHLLSTLISRQREVLADAAAVELSRNPAALARAIYKAHLKNSFVGDFNLTYSPLFIVPPQSRKDRDGLLQRIFDTHPPLMKRVRLLAAMIPASPGKIVREVWEIQRKREEARSVLHAFEEKAKPSVTAPPRLDSEDGRIWAVRTQGRWEGPLNLEEMLSMRSFTPKIWIKNLQESVEAPAREFPQIRIGIRNLYQKKPINPARHNRCPRCRVPLHDNFYEGVAIKNCPDCDGRLIDSSAIDRIIARREVSFSPALLEKAQEFKDRFMGNPIRTQKIDHNKSPRIYCPQCGTRMLPRPYNYQYIVPVDKCLSCHKIWFDSDELEILQILIETR